MIPCLRFTCAIFKCVTWNPYFSCTHAWNSSYVAPCWNLDISISSRENSTLTFWLEMFPLESWTTVSTWHESCFYILIYKARASTSRKRTWILFFSRRGTCRSYFTVTGTCRETGILIAAPPESFCIKNQPVVLLTNLHLRSTTCLLLRHILLPENPS